MSDKYIQNAAANFTIIKASIKRHNGKIKLVTGSRQAAIDAGADPECFDGYVNMLGNQQSEFCHVKALYLAIYNYIYSISLPFERGFYLVPAYTVPDVLAKLAKMRLRPWWK